MTYPETVDFLYTQLPMYQRVGRAAYKIDLTNTIRLLDLLGNPHTTFKSIHIAGTNGKGSVTHMIAAGLQQAGYKTGIYCSPHLRDFRERIKIDGQWVDENFVIDFVEQLKPHLPDIQPSFFEITVAMAFSYFARETIDIAVVEVGLGGRLDSTNVLQPLLSVITNISYDHQQMLGNTLEEIAGEKAGIIKQETPVIIGRRQDETIPVFKRKAEAMQALLIYANDQYAGTVKATSLNQMEVGINNLANGEIYNLAVETGASYQLENIVTAFASLKQLTNKLPKLSDKSIVEGLGRFKAITGFSGRWQVLQEKEPMVLADCAHNNNALSLVFAQVQSLPYDQLHCVIGTVSDKDVNQFLEVLPKRATYYFCRPDVPRGLDDQALAEAARNKGFTGKNYGSVENAYREALKAAGPKDLVYVGGSIFVVAEIL